MEAARRENLNRQQKEFADLMEAAGWNGAETARQLEMSRSAVSQILSGKNTPDPQTLELLRIKVLAVTGYPRREEKIIVRESGQGPYWGTTTLAPIVSAAAAGVGREFLDAEHAAPMINVNCKDPNCYCVVVWGHSMEPIYQTGDVLVIAPGLQVNANDLVVFKDDRDEPYFKKYLGLKKGRHHFASLNPNFELKVLEPEEVQRMHPVHSVIRPLKGKIF